MLSENGTPNFTNVPHSESFAEMCCLEHCLIDRCTDLLRPVRPQHAEEVDTSLRDAFPEKAAACRAAGRPAGVCSVISLHASGQLADDFASFLEKAFDVAHVEHRDRCRRLAALVIARARTTRCPVLCPPMSRRCQ